MIVDDPGDRPISVDGHDETAAGCDQLDRLCDVARQTLLGEGVDGGHLDLILVDTDRMAELNTEHMGHNGPTDVLSFPLDGPDLDLGGPDLAGLDPSEALHLGDIVVCPQVAEAQAAQHSGGYDSELTLLVVHGVLHVLGHDHAEPDETTRMQAREREHMARHGFGHPVPA